MHACADIISSVPFFEDAEEGFTTSLVTCLKTQVSLKGDFVVREGEVSREMYFIKSGAVQAMPSNYYPTCASEPFSCIQTVSERGQAFNPDKK